MGSDLGRMQFACRAVHAPLGACIGSSLHVYVQGGKGNNLALHMGGCVTTDWVMSHTHVCLAVRSSGLHIIKGISASALHPYMYSATASSAAPGSKTKLLLRTLLSVTL